MPLINCKINLILTWFTECVISSATGARKFKITDAKFYVPVLNFSSGFKTAITWNKYQSKVTIQEPSPYLDYFSDIDFQGVNRLLFYRLKMLQIEQSTQDIIIQR